MISRVINKPLRVLAPLSKYTYQSKHLKRYFSSDLEEIHEEIRTIVATNPIVVFSGDSCPYCVQAINALKAAHQIPFVVKASWDQRAALYEMTSSKSIPNIWVRGQYVGGCNDGPEPWMGIRKMITSGKLNEMLLK